MPGEEAASDKTEDATPRKRQQERERGRVAKSKDLGAAVILLAAAVLLRVGGGMMGDMMGLTFERIMGWNGQMAAILPPTGVEVIPHMLNWMLYLAVCGGPYLVAVFLAAAAANYGQTGFLFASKALEPDINKINPVSGFQRMFSLRSFMTLAMNLAKITLLAAVAWPTIEDAIGRAPILMDRDAQATSVYLATTVLDLAILLAALLLILGVADYGYQRFQMEKDMRMTKQQVKEEYKDTDGNPEIKAKRRQLHRQMAQERMMQDVPNADVVIRNPTHYAVALKYDMAAGNPSPTVVAKGVDFIALKIIDIAKEAGVVVWTDRALARQLHDKLEVGQAIPHELYQPVAEILGYVYQHGKNRTDWNLHKDNTEPERQSAEAWY